MAWLKVSFWLVSVAAAGWFRRGLACLAGAFVAREAGAFFLGIFFVAGFFMCRQLGLRYGLRFLRHQLFEAFVGAQGGKLGVGVHLLDVLIAFFHGFAQILERVSEVARLSVHLGNHERERGAVIGRTRLGHYPNPRNPIENVWIEEVCRQILL